MKDILNKNTFHQLTALSLVIFTTLFAVTNCYAVENKQDDAQINAELKPVIKLTPSSSLNTEQPLVKSGDTATDNNSQAIAQDSGAVKAKAEIKAIKLIWGDTVYSFAKAHWPVAYCIKEMNKLNDKFMIYEGSTLKVPNLVKGKKIDLALYCPNYANGSENSVVKPKVTVTEYQKKAEIAHAQRQLELAAKKEAELAESAEKTRLAKQLAAQKKADAKQAALAKKLAQAQAAKAQAEKEANLAEQMRLTAADEARTTFKLDSSLTLKENLEDWLERADGQLIWNATSDMEVKTDRIIARDLVSALEHISTRLHDYHLQFFAKNLTLVVTEK